MYNIILGGGEVGRGLYEAVKDAHRTTVIDTDRKKCINLVCIGPVHILNICIPGTLPDFVQIVCNAVKLYDPAILIIHSTVKVGTTRDIARRVGIPTFHSPIRGKHPNLAAHILAYSKHIGYIDTKELATVKRFFTEAGITTESYEKPETTELGKILELMRYGINVAVADQERKLCDDFGVEYDSTVNGFVRTYNAGLAEVGMPEYTMPIITPPTGTIGGHCVVQNTKLLRSQIKDTEYLTQHMSMIMDLITECDGASHV